MSIIKGTVGQFQCALEGGHVLSEADEDELYNSKTQQIEAACSRCGIAVRAEICGDNYNEYLVVEKHLEELSATA